MNKKIKNNKYNQVLIIRNNDDFTAISDMYSFSLNFEDGVLQKIDLEFSVDAETWVLINENNIFNIQNTIFNNDEEFDLNTNKSIEIICFINPLELEKIEVYEPEEFNNLFCNKSLDFCNDTIWFIDKILQNEEIPSNLQGELKYGLTTNWKELYYPNKQIIKSELFQDIFLFFSSAFDTLKVTIENERFQWDLSEQIPNAIGEIVFKAELKQIIFYINLPFNLPSDKLHKLLNEIISE